MAQTSPRPTVRKKKKESKAPLILFLAIIVIGVVIAVAAFQKSTPEAKVDQTSTETTQPPVNDAPSDTTPPVLTVPETITVQRGESVDLVSYAKVSDDSGDVLTTTVSGEYNLQTAGTYNLIFKTADASGNTAQKNVTLIVLADPFNEDGTLIDGTYPTKTGHTLVIADGIAKVDGILIANKSYPRPATYTSAFMTPETAAAYEEMRAAAKKAGFTLTVSSAYRSYYDQKIIFNNYVQSDGLQNALTYSARPGHSEHQTGMGLDLIKPDTELSKVSPYVEPLNWLNENAWRYGFTLRFPADQEKETGYIYESWHYRYVGKDLAETLYNGGHWISLEKYFGIDSVYRGYDN